MGSVVKKRRAKMRKHKHKKLRNSSRHKKKK
ncbi:MAG TPA: AURKAIP1/COX24 domain-containing protein [Nitrospinota bacterium]|nr:AURKAIP1/COX24 domain-containing protein [Nitrospinota bacterium]